MPPFLLRPRWLALHLLVLAVVLACAALGFWQLGRLGERRARNSLLETRLSQPPEALEDLMARYRLELPAEHPQSLWHRPALAQGRYDPAREVLWQRGSSYRGEPGHQLLTPLVLGDGRALLVNRGWVPFSYRRPPVPEAAPPAGEVTVVGVLGPGQTPPTGFWANFAPRNPPGELEITAYADTARLQEQLPYEVLPTLLELREQRPRQDGLLPIVQPAPALGDGPHLGYAIQWFAFAAIGLVGYGMLLRRLALERG